MQVLLVLTKKKIRQMASFALESKVGCQVIEAATVAEALEPLLKGTKIDLIVVEHPSNTDALFKYLMAVNQKVPCVVFNAEPSTALPDFGNQNILGVLVEADLLEALVRLSEDFKKTLAKEDAGTDHVSDFCRIKVDLLRGIKKLESDVYIRLSESKFVKLFLKGDLFESQDRQKYLVEKKIEYLYVRKEDSNSLVQKFKSDIKRLLEAATVNPEEADRVVVSVHETATDLIQRLGPQPEVQAMIKDNIMLSVKSMGKNPKLKGVLSKLTTDRKSYISSHSLFLAQLSCAVASNLEWESDMTFQKLTMAAFLHDIVLTDQEMAMLQTKEQIQEVADLYSKDDLRNYILHPAKAADIARQFSELPPDTDFIIQQHHEQPDGTGFPRGLTHKQIIPLSCLFIIAHDLMNEIYKKGKEFQIEEFLERTREKYSVGNFRKVHQALKDLKV